MALRFFCLATLFLWGWEFAAYSEPRFVCDELMADLGDTPFDEVFQYDFVVTNTGTTDLTLKAMATSCKCAFEISSSTPIAPGNSETITVGYVPVANEWKQGKHAAEAWFETNDPTHEVVHLRVEANLVSPVVLQPSVLKLPKMQPGESVEESFEVVFLNPTDASEVVSVVCETDGFDIQAQPVEEETKGKFKYLLRYEGKRHVGPLQAFLRVTTNNVQVPELEMRVDGVVEPQIRTLSDPIVFRVDKDTDAFSNMVSLKSEKVVDWNAIKIRSPEFVSAQFAVENSSDKEVELQIQISKHGMSRGMHYIELEDAAGLLLGRIRIVVPKTR